VCEGAVAEVANMSVADWKAIQQEAAKSKSSAIVCAAWPPIPPEVCVFGCARSRACFRMSRERGVTVTWAVSSAALRLQLRRRKPPGPPSDSRMAYHGAREYHYFQAKCPFHMTSSGTKKCEKGIKAQVKAANTLTQKEAEDIIERMAAHVWSSHADECSDEYPNSWWAQQAVDSHGEFWSEKEEPARSRSPRVSTASSGSTCAPTPAQVRHLSTGVLTEVLREAKKELLRRGVGL
jgi:hypothetical protein